MHKIKSTKKSQFYKFHYKEEDCIKYFIKHIKKRIKGDYKIIIRPHPADTTSDIKQITQKFKKNIEISKIKELGEDILNADMVFGTNSMGLVIAYKAFGKKAYNVLPLKKVKNIIPLRAIKNLNEI